MIGTTNANGSKRLKLARVILHSLVIMKLLSYEGPTPSQETFFTPNM